MESSFSASDTAAFNQSVDSASIGPTKVVGAETKPPVLSPGLALRPRKSLTHADIQVLVENAPGDIVAELIPQGSVNIAVGDSGLGKTPLLIQLALCIASGKPFLNQAVQQGNVLWVDYENGLSGLASLLETLAEHLGLEGVPDSLRILHQPSSKQEVDQEINGFQPILVIVDALRGFDASAERDNSAAGALITSRQQVAKKFGTAWLLIHHIRKQDLKNTPPTLMGTPSVMEWLLQAAGARALVNQSAVRIGIDAHRVGGIEMVIRGHYKLRGEFGPWSIARVYDETGEPVGYKRLTGADLLHQAQRDKFKALPNEFTFSEAERIYGKKGGKPTAEWLKLCQGAGILEKRGRGKGTKYKKVEEPHPPGS